MPVLSEGVGEEATGLDGDGSGGYVSGVGVHCSLKVEKVLGWEAVRRGSWVEFGGGGAESEGLRRVGVLRGEGCLRWLGLCGIALSLCLAEGGSLCSRGPGGGGG